MQAKRLAVVLLLISALVASVASPAAAIQGGELVINDQRVAALLSSQDATRPICSVAYVTNWVIATAAHCVTKKNDLDGGFSAPIDSFWVSGPGEDLNAGKFDSRIRVVAAFRSEGYLNIWIPANNDARTQKDDIAFLVLEKPAKNNFKLEVATVAEVQKIKSSSAEIMHIGYGMQAAGQLDGKPYKIYLNSHSLGSARYSNPAALESHTITTNETGVKAVCPGDSGSPWYSIINGVEKLVAVTVGGSGCGGSGVNGALGTIAGQYPNLLKSAMEKASQLEKLQNDAVILAKKKSTIVCVRGKTRKTISGISPKCPAGYKKK